MENNDNTADRPSKRKREDAGFTPDADAGAVTQDKQQQQVLPSQDLLEQMATQDDNHPPASGDQDVTNEAIGRALEAYIAKLRAYSAVICESDTSRENKLAWVDTLVGLYTDLKDWYGPVCDDP
ncbi:uncharacterized protein ACA1_131200 [Acanthamoeba castellanii str. Neff]|uniref:Uncharacterized protein n=1 Tax=Acanthamoeba castellanii (strain ATCC 30010 / Neff) TaxID=1257118 RepID=L8GMV4_ACACF|nr:uncharacterized protein ACA1_131200 [Acanthamoeba castellanii str. Neff]ELR14139.1 hypothetical protein ACA1_131200 [Acanthamoeba castellanii str. Neff]